VHNLGGCVMADSPADGVVNGWGESFAYPGLFVADGSILPRATGANPSATIAAVAERNVERFVRTHLGPPNWRAPERDLAPPIAEPLGGVSIPTDGTAPPTERSLSLSFPENIQGYFTRTPTGPGLWLDARLTVVIGSLERLIAEPVSTGTLAGIVT